MAKCGPVTSSLVILSLYAKINKIWIQSLPVGAMHMRFPSHF